MNGFHRWYCRSERWRRRLERAVLPWVLRDVDVAGAAVLEIGPGPGLTTDALVARGGTVTALEYDERLAESLRRRTAGVVDVRRGDAAAMPFPDASFAVVGSFTMLHHLPSSEHQDRTLAECRRVLRPGGVFVGCDSRTSARFRLAHVGDTLVPVDPGTFADRLVQAGFEDVDVSTAPRAFRFKAAAPLR